MKYAVFHHKTEKHVLYCRIHKLPDMVRKQYRKVPSVHKRISDDTTETESDSSLTLS